jgi:SP family xylose:H+ symportor-like MFS transporter
VNLLATGLATFLIDLLGRKQLLEWGTALMTVSLLALALVLLLFPAGALQGVLAVLAVLVYVVGFAVGLGAVSWVVMSEIMSQRLRSKAFGLFVSINWGINLVIGLLTLSAIDALGGLQEDMDDEEKSDAEKRGVAFLFVIFGGICFLSQLFIHFYVPETKGKNPNDFVLSSECSIFDRISSLKFNSISSSISSDDSIPDSSPLLS